MDDLLVFLVFLFLLVQLPLIQFFLEVLKSLLIIIPNLDDVFFDHLLLVILIWLFVGWNDLRLDVDLNTILNSILNNL